MLDKTPQKNYWKVSCCIKKCWSAPRINLTVNYCSGTNIVFGVGFKSKVKGATSIMDIFTITNNYLKVRVF